MASQKFFSRTLSQTPPMLAGFLGGLGLLAALALGWAVRELGILLFALLVATFLATGLNRLVAPMADRGLPRSLAVTAVVLGILVLVAGILLAVIPALVNQASELIASLPGYYEWLMQTPLADRLGGEERLLQQLQSFATPENASMAFNGLLGGVATALGLFAWGLTALVLTVFILASFERLREGAINLVVASKRERTAEILDGILSQIGAYLLGALSIGALAGISAWIFLTIAGVPYAALLALLVAILDLVPQIGATIGATVSILVAFTVSLGTAIAALIFFILYQQIENWIIYPRIMQNAVKITNLAAIVSVLIGAALFGVTGVVLAIPVYASLRLVYKEILAPKLEAH